MTCLKKIQNTEVFGSKFSSKMLTTGNSGLRFFDGVNWLAIPTSID